MIITRVFRCSTLNLLKLNKSLINTRPLINGQRLLSTKTADLKDKHGGHDHSKTWLREKILSAGLLAIIPAAFIAPGIPGIDYALALSLITHVHWGVEAIVIDYVRPAIFGNVIPKVSVASVYLISILALAGLFYFNFTDVGMTQAIRMIAKL